MYLVLILNNINNWKYDCMLFYIIFSLPTTFCHFVFYEWAYEFMFPCADFTIQKIKNGSKVKYFFLVLLNF